MSDHTAELFFAGARVGVAVGLLVLVSCLVLVLGVSLFRRISGV